ncbi:hypothetical protein AB0M97_05700 [Streptomyces sp. NPDC051207]|uniref:hypothetical protein n=1 Tax=Streptomyces sp. NPDC051207 TaxID=3154641 RepID=UPI00344A5728
MGTDRPTDAVEGVPAVVEAAHEHRIDTLLVRPDGSDLSRETWVCKQPDQVAVRRTDAQTLGESDPVPVRADDALLRSAAVTAADVLVIPAADPLDTSDGSDGSEASGEDADTPVGGLGALLRWTYEPTAGVTTADGR